MKNALLKTCLILLLFILTYLDCESLSFNYAFTAPIIMDYSGPNNPTPPSDDSELYGYLITDSILL